MRSLTIDWPCVICFIHAPLQLIHTKKKHDLTANCNHFFFRFPLRSLDCNSVKFLFHVPIRCAFHEISSKIIFENKTQKTYFSVAFSFSLYESPIRDQGMKQVLHVIYVAVTSHFGSNSSNVLFIPVSRLLNNNCIEWKISV